MFCLLGVWDLCDLFESYGVGSSPAWECDGRRIAING